MATFPTRGLTLHRLEHVEKTQIRASRNMLRWCVVCLPPTRHSPYVIGLISIYLQYFDIEHRPPSVPSRLEHLPGPDLYVLFGAG